MDLAEAKERLAYWQRVLRLQDWRIELREAAAIEMDEGRSWAKTKEVAEHKTAQIRMVLDRAEAGEPSLQGGVCWDPEHNLLHELLHLLLRDWPTEKDSPGATAQELAINLLCEAFLGRRRTGSSAGGQE